MPVSPITPPTLSGPTSVAGLGQVPAAPAGVGDGGFGDVLAGQVDALAQMHSTTADLAQKAATGDVTDVHDYMIAATETQLATETVVALRNKAVDAFNEIMRMPV